MELDKAASKETKRVAKKAAAEKADQDASTYSAKSGAICTLGLGSVLPVTRFDIPLLDFYALRTPLIEIWPDALIRSRPSYTLFML